MPTKAFERLDPKKRKNILDAAFREFEENTVDTASVNSIAIRAGVSRTTLYYYFHDINDIFSTVIDVLMNEFKQRMFMNVEKTQIDIFDSFHSFLRLVHLSKVLLLFEIHHFYYMNALIQQQKHLLLNF